MTDQSRQRADHIIEGQSWLVSVVVRHVVEEIEFTTDYSALDAAIEAVIRALTGWQPPSAHRTLRYERRVFPEDELEPGFLEVVLEFSTLYHLSVS